MNEVEQFVRRWNSVAAGTVALMRALPADRYDFRPDAGARSIGELAWHLAELDGYLSFGIARRSFSSGEKPPNTARPRTTGDLAPAYERIHREAVERIERLGLDELDEELPYLDGSSHSIRDLLWNRVLLHAVHHRGQLVVLCRLAGGIAPSVAGPNREDDVRRRAPAAAG
jgi:uncharacterized damage-inducible protein DinB